MTANEVDSSLPHVAVVAIGRNEGDRLRQCLASVQSMNYPSELLDVVYVDSNSSDNSVAMARAMGVRTIVLDGPTTAARGRNAGWTTVTAPFVLFLDGDTLLHPEFVRSALAVLADPTVAGAFGARRELRCEASVYNAVFDLDWSSKPGPTLYFGGDALVRVAALRAVGGYNAALIAGEEPDMCRRIRGLGYKILRMDVPMTLHDLDMHTFRAYWKRSVRTGYAYAEVSSFYKATSDPLWLSDSKRNLARGLLWMGLPVVAVIASLVMHSVLPLLVFVLLAGLLMGRTAMKVRKRTSSVKQQVAYGIHSHLQHIPILIGQFRFWMFGRGQHKAGIIEYKTTQ